LGVENTQDIKAEQPPQESELVQRIFEDFEAKSNLVGFFDLALKVTKRNPKLWAEINNKNQPNL
jgi:hypothetical protein